MAWRVTVRSYADEKDMIEADNGDLTAPLLILNGGAAA
jgi:hypothetical protein